MPDMTWAALIREWDRRSAQAPHGPTLPTVSRAAVCGILRPESAEGRLVDRRRRFGPGRTVPAVASVLRRWVTDDHHEGRSRDRRDRDPTGGPNSLSGADGARRRQGTGRRRAG